MDRSERYYRYCDDEAIDWIKEAKGVINDIAAHVQVAFVSEKLPSTATKSYFNVTTLGGKHMCVKVSSEGLQVVADEYDKTDKENTENMWFETPYSLLSVVCPLYAKSFGNALAKALSKLENKSSEIGENDMSDEC